MKELVVYEHVNPKQNIFHDTVMKSVARVPGYDFRYFLYGGGIRGGKTFVCLFLLLQLAKLFPGSRWLVVREDNPALESTSIPSMEKLIGKDGEYFKWKRSKGDVQIIFKNGSRIFFKSENIVRDPELKEFLGMEINGILLEQLEALSEKLWTRAMERIGSWYITPMPIPIILATFNPDPGWIKPRFYDQWFKGLLKAPYFYQDALANDNAFVTKDQWANWENLDPESNKIMIKGVWIFKVIGNIWAYSFSEERNVLSQADPRMKLQRQYPVVLMFDFNVDPMTCIVCQYSGKGLEWGRIISEYRLPNSDIYEMTERLRIDFAGYYLIASGDASGRNRDGRSKGAKSYTDIIRAELNLTDRQMQFPTANPSIKNTRPVVNSLFHKHNNFFISDACMFTIRDLLTVKTDEHGDLDEDQFKKDKNKGHFLALVRYFGWNYFRTFVRIN